MFYNYLGLLISGDLKVLWPLAKNKSNLPRYITSLYTYCKKYVLRKRVLKRVTNLSLLHIWWPQMTFGLNSLQNDDFFVIWQIYTPSTKCTSLLFWTSCKQYFPFYISGYLKWRLTSPKSNSVLFLNMTNLYYKFEENSSLPAWDNVFRSNCHSCWRFTSGELG